MLSRRLIIEQLDLISELIKKNTSWDLRIALILLDNVIEILIYRKFTDDDKYNFH